MHDHNGNPLRVGAIVNIPCVIQSLAGTPDYCNVGLETVHGRKPDGQKEHFSAVNTHQLELVDDRLPRPAGRLLTSHKVNGLNEAIVIEVLDDPGQGNACHEYSLRIDTGNSGQNLGIIHFQNGPVQEVGFNGLSNEALLAVVEDRLIGFQSGQYACRENAIALTHIQDAMMWLQKRTRDRVARGVEGTSQK